MPRTDDEQRQAILVAASRILSDEGAGALTVRRIASEAGCSTMGLYSRFGGKEGVVDELYVEGFRHLCDGMSAVPKTDDPVTDLRECARAYRTTALSHATHYMVMFGGAVPEFVPTRPSLGVAHIAFERLVRQVQRCIDAGTFKGDAAEIAEVWWGAMHGLVMLEIVGIRPTKADPGARYDRLLDTLVDGLTQ
ncbi:MAG TPA: WHG domain-containing protein [Acidimicrobiia bacterium]|nr:WHG domain-containing protein [Acidimicrobiia bacterium]